MTNTKYNKHVLARHASDTDAVRLLGVRCTQGYMVIKKGNTTSCLPSDQVICS